MNRPVDLPFAATDAEEASSHTSTNACLAEVIDARLSRRAMLRGALGSGASVVLGSFAVSACGGGGDDGGADALAAPQGAAGKHGGEPLLSFGAVAKSLEDRVTVPEGYTATVVYATGDTLRRETPAFRNDGSDTDWEHRAGDHHDGMQFFGLSRNGKRPDAGATDRGLLAMNHEAISQHYLHPAGATPNAAPTRPAAEVDKEIAAHGVSVVEVRRHGKTWRYEADSPFNRRITPDTPIEIAGPLRGHPLMATRFDPSGRRTRGTINNCGTGLTPWGTLLTGEENWAGYFYRAAGDTARRDAKANASLARYGRNASGSAASSRHAWEKSDAADDRIRRFDISATGGSAAEDYRNELNGQGYMTEIDPYDAKASVRKRSALGRFAHESAAFSRLEPGRPLAVYMGDDSQNEYCYKWVSAAAWSERDREPADRMACGDKYLDHGRLYVARFAADGTGEWIELAPEHPAIAGYAGYAFADQADVVVNARLAADAVGATKMDRPEWSAVHPGTGEVYYTLTNNASRTPDKVDAANPRSYLEASFDGAPRADTPANRRNWNGHIVRLRERDGRADATGFVWDVYLFGAEAGAAPGINLSALTDDQDFSSPDGLWFSERTGICWIQTDDGAYTDRTHCMMLAGLPGRVGDGVKTRVDNGGAPVDTYVGRKPSAATLKRFLVGPTDCEITGVTETADGRTLFVNIQHPGETISLQTIGDPAAYVSHWPGNAGYGAGGALARPRSATLAITKNDGGRIGS